MTEYIFPSSFQEAKSTHTEGALCCHCTRQCQQIQRTPMKSWNPVLSGEPGRGKVNVATSSRNMSMHLASCRSRHGLQGCGPAAPHPTRTFQGPHWGEWSGIR